MTRLVHRASVEDYGFVLKAQRASIYEREIPSDYDIYEDLQNGYSLTLILTVDFEYRAMVSAGIEGKSAMVSCLYRLGPTHESVGDFNVLLGFLRHELEKLGVKYVYACVSDANPKKAKIERHHKRMGFKQDMIRMSMEI